jgi:DNA repair protein RadC
MAGDRDSTKPSGPAAKPPHYYGHRERLRERFLKGGSEALADYELLELVLFRAIARRDLKPLAKELLEQFGSFAEAVSAPIERLKSIKGLGEAAITELKISLIIVCGSPYRIFVN